MTPTKRGKHHLSQLNLILLHVQAIWQFVSISNLMHIVQKRQEIPSVQDIILTSISLCTADKQLIQSMYYLSSTLGYTDLNNLAQMLLILQLIG